MKQYPLIQNFDGHKFEVRYSLSAIRGDFFVDGQGMLNVPDGLPDDPPIQETTDPITMPPAGIDVHALFQTVKKQGDKLIAGGQAKCIHMVIDTVALLDDPYITTFPLEIGSTAFVKSLSQIGYWNGTIWVQYDGKPLKP